MKSTTVLVLMLMATVISGATEYPNLYDETMPMIWLSSIVYQFAKLIHEARSDNNSLTIPQEIMNEYKDKRLDVRGFNNGRGLSFDQLYHQFIGQVEELKQIGILDDGYDLSVVKRMKEIEDRKEGDQLFLEVFDSLHGKKECVYGVFRDEYHKRVIIAFRGSSTKTDWGINLSAQLIKMRTPKLLRKKLKGKLSQDVKVHRGMYEYLFNNGEQDGDQVYNKILQDIKPAAKDGYTIYVTGHSLGAALSSMLAFKLAGSKKKWIPKPINLINYASPYVGGKGFRTAFQQLEQDGLIRYLRITNSKDIVPTLPPVAPSIFKGGRFCHNGIHLNLDEGDYDISYPNKGNGLGRAWSSNFLKPFWAFGTYHAIPTVDARMNMHREALSNMTIDGIYEDESIIGGGFWSE